jgi:UPF0716 family protein affecting phage T7 exclusion
MIAAILLIHPEWITSLVGMGLGSLILFPQFQLKGLSKGGSKSKEA